MSAESDVYDRRVVAGVAIGVIGGMTTFGGVLVGLGSFRMEDRVEAAKQLYESGVVDLVGICLMIIGYAIVRENDAKSFSN